MKWKLPPKIKIFEALSAIADRRVRVEKYTATVVSSSGNKEYQVVYDQDKNAITSNDNGSYWQGYLGYPAIAFLMLKGILSYDPTTAELLKGIAWKDINQEHKNDFDRVEDWVKGRLKEGDRKKLDQEVEEIMRQIKELKSEKLPAKIKPPTGY